MSDTDQANAAEDGNGNGQSTDAVPRLSILTQFIKDLSFENPNAPGSLVQGGQQPQISIAVDVQARRSGEANYEVELRISANAKQGETSVFLVELVYSGLFALQNIPNENLQAVLLIECPRQIFPFARRIVADVTRDGGFPPLMLDPIDFAQLYQRQMAAAQETANSETPN